MFRCEIYNAILDNFLSTRRVMIDVTPSYFSFFLFFFFFSLSLFFFPYHEDLNNEIEFSNGARWKVKAETLLYTAGDVFILWCQLYRLVNVY